MTTWSRTLQPLLHDLICTVRAPTTALGGRDGQIRSAGVQGVFHADRRILSEAVLLVDGREPEPIGVASGGPGVDRFVAVLRHLGDPGPDPTVRLDRVRQVLPTGMAEELRVESSAAGTVRATISLRLACDLAAIHDVKAGRGGVPRPPQTGHATPPEGRLAPPDALRTDPSPLDAGLTWQFPGGEIGVEADQAATVDPATGALFWQITVEPRGSVVLRWRLAVRDAHAMVAASSAPVPWRRPEVSADDRRVPRLVARSLDDLESLRLYLPGEPDATFLGAGAPWYLTLFGRDSIWAARMLLPLGTELAGGTLRALARHQGRRTDPHTGEAPGKIMHELRRDDEPSAGRLPATYYGTVDATPLWISLLHDAWRWGMPEAEVGALLPNLTAALGWLRDDADADGDGFIEYLDASGRGLANQGWKDSGDAIRFADGRRARPPIALVEVQGYAYAAALHGADLLDAFDLPGSDEWRAYAERMAQNFRARFWVDDPAGPYPALALDRDKRPVDALTSNIGHLLGTGLLSSSEEALVAHRLAEPEMAGGYGLRTMSAANGGFQPLSYHCGSIWPHDTAIVAAGLAAAGHDTSAAALIDGLLAAAEAFDYRLPEVYAGDSRADLARPMPYPAACHPQAWSAATGVAILAIALGLSPDMPSGRLRLRPLRGAPLGALRATGMQLAGRAIEVEVDAVGAAYVSGLPSGIGIVEQVSAGQDRRW